MMTPRETTQMQAVLTSAHKDYSKNLKSYAFLKIHDRAIGENMVQDTFMKTWQYLVRGGKIDMMKAFLFHVLNDLIVDEYRKHKEISLDVLIEKGFDSDIKEHERLINFLDGKAAMVLIKRLPEIYQKVMQMRYIQDLSLREMSLITGQSKNTLAVRAHRGLEKLKLLYEYDH